MSDNDYILITPSRNEEKFIENTIQSVLAQTILPKRWVIVSDGSTDRTDEIVVRYAKDNTFIVFLQTGSGVERNFGSKVHAFRAGYQQLGETDYRFIGNLDADVTIGPNYYARVMQCFHENPRLGIAGGLICELIGDHFVAQRNSENSVAGAVQVFRRKCYEEIGGYTPLPFGGIDSAAEIMARMRGWEVRTFPDLPVYHHRRVASGGKGLVRTKLRHGMGHYSLGYHPLFELLRCGYRMVDRPYILGGVLMAAGYFWALTTRQERGIPKEVVRYLRSEQTRAIYRRYLKTYIRSFRKVTGALRSSGFASAAPEQQKKA